MKRFTTAVALLGMAAVLAFATPAGKSETVDGYLVDVMCGSHHASEGAAYAAGHKKECLLMPACVKSGYAVLTPDKKLLKLDDKGNKQAAKLIKSTDRDTDFHVKVTGEVKEDQIAVKSIAFTK